MHVVAYIIIFLLFTSSFEFFISISDEIALK